MNGPYNPKAAKKACNLSVNGDLVRLARELDINLSQALEEALAGKIREAKAKAWREENREAIEAHNRHVDQHGLWSDGLRMF